MMSVALGMSCWKRMMW